MTISNDYSHMRSVSYSYLVEAIIFCCFLYRGRPVSLDGTYEETTPFTISESVARKQAEAEGVSVPSPPARDPPSKKPETGTGLEGDNLLPSLDDSKDGIYEHTPL